MIAPGNVKDALSGPLEVSNDQGFSVFIEHAVMKRHRFHQCGHADLSGLINNDPNGPTLVFLLFDSGQDLLLLIVEYQRAQRVLAIVQGSDAKKLSKEIPSVPFTPEPQVFYIRCEFSH